MKIKKLETKLFWLLLTIGALSRLYLILKLPIWLDEYYALKVITHPLNEIITGDLNRVYPPGYYTFLKLWSYVSVNHIWLRISTLFFFVFNAALVYKIGIQLKDRLMGLFLVTLYTFSGYFVIFDWQFTMYTCLATSILASYYFYILPQTRRTSAFHLISNMVGLFTHYGFLFYLLPLTAWSCFKSVVAKDKSEKPKTSLLLTSLVLFLVVWGIMFYLALASGTDWISWVKPFTSPTFFIPFFLGSHMNKFLDIVFISLASIGIYTTFKYKKPSFSKTLVGVAAFSLVFSMAFSHFVKPILHVRSLQIVGIAVLILYAEGLYYSYNHSKFLTFSIILLLIINYLLMIYNFQEFAGWYLVRFDKPL